jgi:hypothetical protein
MQASQPVSLVAKGAESAWLWHALFGHLNFRALRRLACEGLVRGLSKIDQVSKKLINWSNCALAVLWENKGELHFLGSQSTR